MLDVPGVMSMRPSCIPDFTIFFDKNSLFVKESFFSRKSTAFKQPTFPSVTQDCMFAYSDPLSTPVL
jgi:hypothetical protein